MASTSDFGFLLWKTGASLVAVLALLLIVAYLVRRFGLQPKSSAGNLINILARQALGPKHYLLLVQVQDALLLLAVSPEGIKLLKSMERSAAAQEEAAPEANAPSSQKTFEAILERLTGFNKNKCVKVRPEC